MDTPQFSRETPDAAAERTARHLAVLQELAEIGMQMARAVRDEALACPADEPGRAADLGLRFSRIARAVRQTVALEAKLAEDRLKPASRELGVSDRWRSARRKRQVREIVGQIIEDEPSDSEFKRLLGELKERLEDGEDDADFADRPIGELVARICRDLGVTLDLRRFEDEDWAAEANPLSPAKREGEDRERAGAGLAACAAGPAMTHLDQALARPSG